MQEELKGCVEEVNLEGWRWKVGTEGVKENVNNVFNMEETDNIPR